MTEISILAKPVIDAWLEQGKRNLQAHGYLVGVLFLRTISGRLDMVELSGLMQAEDSDEKMLLMSALGKRLRDKIGEITEAVILHEGWYVMAKETGALNTRPSQHPARKEAIAIFGRNADNTRTTSVVQPFSRDEDNRLVWEKQPITVYNAPTKDNPAPVGLLDYLFNSVGKTS